MDSQPEFFILLILGALIHLPDCVKSMCLKVPFGLAETGMMWFMCVHNLVCSCSKSVCTLCTLICQGKCSGKSYHHQTISYLSKLQCLSDHSVCTYVWWSLSILDNLGTALYSGQPWDSLECAVRTRCPHFKGIVFVWYVVGIDHSVLNLSILFKLSVLISGYSFYYTKYVSVTKVNYIVI